MEDSKKKYSTISLELRAQIVNGNLSPGTKIPTERNLAERYGVSRPTVIRALNDLVNEGLIERRVGAGSFVTKIDPPKEALNFGLLVPGLGRGEIFEPICARIAERAPTDGFTLSWGGTTRGTDGGSTILHAVESYVKQRVDGIFFQPVEFDPELERINHDVIDLLQASQIPVVLLDADYKAFPERGDFDIVGINNVRAAWVATEHLIKQGAQRVDFVSTPLIATTAVSRLGGYRLALTSNCIVLDAEWEHSINPEDIAQVQQMIASGARDIMCVTDEIAALLIPILERLEYRVPDDIRIVGFDDVKYARLVRVPLTTMKQPCAAIGDAAVDAMLSRIAKPNRAPREFLLEAELMVRHSSIRPWMEG